MPEHIGGALADIDAVFADLGRAQSASDLHGETWRPTSPLRSAKWTM
jgi:hypothetical protein